MPKQILQSIFGYDSFRPLQEDIIAAVLNKQDTIVLMPTGGGKSLCYQIPALAVDGCAIVVSPLISLMHDQVMALQQLGVSAAVYNSSLSSEQRRDVMDSLRYEQLKLLYVSPEQLMMDGFLESLPPISLFAIDEAHCISEWGHDFRPSYRHLSHIKQVFQNTPIMALTATATSRVLGDIQSQLDMPDAQLFRGSFNRPNLFYDIRPKKDTYKHLLAEIKQRPDESGIIYCQSRRSVESVAEKLQKDGIQALPYHAGLSTKVRQDNQEQFKHDRVQVIVATIAFGMGIDKPDVRFVVHYDLPKTIENYYQETGRAGRDGLYSRCILFYSYGDTLKYESFIREMSDPKEQKLATQKLQQMTKFAFQPICRRKQLLHYFDEDYDEKSCNTCDVCVNPPEQWDATIISQKVLSCIYRIKERFGGGMVTDILKGKLTDRIQQLRFDQLSVFGIEKELTNVQIRDVIHYCRLLVQLNKWAMSIQHWP